MSSDSAPQGIGHQLWPATFLLTSYNEARHVAAPGCWQVSQLQAPECWLRCTDLLAQILQWSTVLLPQMSQSKRVLELGAGSGLVSLLCAARGAHVMMTDLPSVLVRLTPSKHYPA